MNCITRREHDGDDQRAQIGGIGQAAGHPAKASTGGASRRRDDASDFPNCGCHQDHAEEERAEGKAAMTLHESASRWAKSVR